MKRSRFAALAGIIAMLSACGGGGGGGATSGGNTGGSTGGGTTNAGCSLRERQDWAAAQMREWYLFPETLPTNISPASYSNVSDYVDALTATARSQRRDRYFTYVTSIAEENAFYNSGASAGFGFRLAYNGNRVFVNEAFEGAPALAAGIDRGAEIVAVGTSAANLRTTASLMASGGAAAFTDALGPSTTGTARVLRITDSGGTRDVTVSKTDYSLAPVSSRYGVKVLNDGGKPVGYVNMRTFINTSDAALRNAFAQFRSAGITEVIIDLRYNGGGLVSIAELFGNLLGGNRSTSDVFSRTTFRAEKASNNSTDYFAPQTQSIAPTKVAFIGTGGTASASELVINSMRPYLGNNATLVGTNTYGKPVGQIALDKAACDDRLRVIAFSTQNANNAGFYYDGLAPVMEQTCQATDDIAYPLGDAREASVARALDFLAGRSCSRISATPDGRTADLRSGERTTLSERPLELLTPERPNTPQREVPGSF